MIDIPEKVGIWIATGGAIVLGIVNIINMFGKTSKESLEQYKEEENELNNLHEDIIESLKTKIAVQDEKISNLKSVIKEQEKKIEELNRNLESLYKRAKDLAELLTDKDPASVKYREEAERIRKKVEEALPLVHDIHKKVTMEEGDKI